MTGKDTANQFGRLRPRRRGRLLALAEVEVLPSTSAASPLSWCAPRLRSTPRARVALASCLLGLVFMTWPGHASAATCTQTGTSGNDVLTGTAANDVLCGLGGDDILKGLGGKD